MSLTSAESTGFVRNSRIFVTSQVSLELVSRGRGISGCLWVHVWAWTVLCHRCQVSLNIGSATCKWKSIFKLVVVEMRSFNLSVFEMGSFNIDLYLLKP